MSAEVIFHCIGCDWAEDVDLHGPVEPGCIDPEAHHTYRPHFGSALPEAWTPTYHCPTHEPERIPGTEYLVRSPGYIVKGLDGKEFCFKCHAGEP